MNERDQALSKALDNLTELRESLEEAEPYQGAIMPFDLWFTITDEAIRHVEAATTMPKPSKIRELFQRVRDVA